MITLENHTCPRCLGGIPNDSERGQYIGALSRTDNQTEICSGCGVTEAIEDWHGQLSPQSQWAAQRFQPLTVAEDAAEGGV